MPFSLPTLPDYRYRDLEPYIDARTMELHHTKHHQAYIHGLNKALEGTNLAYTPITAILKQVSKHGTAVRNHGGGHYNHALFWSILSPRGEGAPSGPLAEAIDQHFGSFEQFQEAFTDAATTQFGSGWAWLYINKEGDLKVCATPNQDNPLMDIMPIEHQGVPILGLDVWEHAYYLTYQNRRAEYIAAFWYLVDWDEVGRRFLAEQ